MHTQSSVPLPGGEFRTERSQLGELLPSTARDFQPVIAIAAKIGEMLDLPAALNYLIKVKRTPPLKNLAPDESRQEQLKGAFDLQFQNANFRCVLLFDDIYRSGETLKAATHVLRDKGGVSRVLVLTLTRTRTKQ